MLAAEAGAGTATLHSKATAISANLVLIDMPSQLRESEWLGCCPNPASTNAPCQLRSVYRRRPLKHQQPSKAEDNNDQQGMCDGRLSKQAN
jgi:hypothetical protein